MKAQGLYDPANEHDACGVGFVAHIKGNKTHSIVEQGLLILKNLDHRGAVGADALMGDGAGILIQIPDQYYREEMAKQGVELPPPGEYGVGMVFLPKEHASRIACEQEIERAVRIEGQVVLGWRNVPIDTDMPMSPTVRAKEPVIRQIFIGRGPDIMVTDALERKLYVIRKSSGHAIQALKLLHGKEFFVPSMSARTIVYKGLLLADQVGVYYKDLQDARCISALALVHQRFSTNTFPEWPLAHPYRLIAHNGEINTVKGNFNWMRAREGVMKSAVLGDDLQKLFPLIYEGQSDTACFDNALELLLMAGYPIAQAMMMMIPEAWENHTTMDDNRRAFYEYHAAMMEPWDGPAAMAFTDGRHIGGTLDRNGLRPARYIVTDDDLVVMASESGVLPIPESKIIQKWRLQPGKMFLIDLEAGRIIDDQELKNTYANAKPYKAWINSVRIKLDEIKLAEGQAKQDRAQGEKEQPSLLDRQQAFGYTQEDLKFLMAPMAVAGEEATGSMGNDSPLAVMSNKLKPLYNYFKQLFAQVTNPPIDPIREAMVMSLVSFIGPKPNLLDTNNVNPPMRLEVAQPVLGFDDMARLRNISAHTGGKFKSYELDICYPLAWGKEGVEACLASLCAEAVDAVKSGHNILIVSDRAICADQVAIPALLATSTVHQHLVSKGLRASTGLVVETGSARETHHFALLAGYGAEAVHPYLAMETLVEMAHGLPGDLSGDKAIYNYTKAVGKGLMKVMSKMGISTYMSYCGAQIFEAIGLNKSLVDKYFKGTASNVEGIGVFEVAEEALRLHALAFGNDPVLVDKLDAGGEYAFRVRGEDHMWTPDAIAKLQHSTRSNNFSSYKEYAQIINDQSRRHLTLRGLFEFKLDPTKAIPLDEVEPAKEIVKRFATGAMSLGSISTEAHATLAVAMNRIGGKSNTGEGGEDPNRYTQELKGIPIRQGDTMASVVGAEQIVVDIPLQEGDSMRSRIKQVASGRFGVTAAYLNSADQIQIKMAQGAKPGEGGQLPGHKVSEYIASLRFSVPGVGLISPPPHHDIYSIEDLAQLIHDLKNANPRASISVKLVSEVGIGTVAAGVTKAKADHVVVAGHDGGTGASPLSSVKHAGTPWELGLAETQQTLVLNGLRSRIRVQADGQMKTGRDVVIAALLGADEIGFATAPLVVEGCIMMRKCHLNTCPVGVATQDPVLRAKFSGKPEYVVNYFFFVAEEARQLMAQLGIRTYDELIGRVDLLDKSKAISHWKAQGLDFSAIFYKPETPDGQACRHVEFQDHALEKALDHKLIAQARAALEKGERVSFISPVRNLNRTVGTMLSGEVAKKYGHAGLPDDTIHIQLQGTAGQSACAFLAHGITIDLVGEGNDYVGKGLSGGRIIVRPNTEFRGWAVDNIIIGNTVLYGAIAGEAFFNGVAGERFAVRNSGATTVVEGLGDHGCEYMTGGTVVVLGNTGRNFAAGMSGGIAYVYDPAGDFASKCNTAMVSLDKVVSAAEQHLDRDAWHTQHRDGVPEADEVILKRLIERHFKHTGSTRARVLLDDWAAARGKFVKVFPNEYKRALIEMAADAAMEVQAVAA
ncbi:MULTISPECIES: glutamate synthase-related protein [unclassified Janthinobacterium]|uniref:glutamate synthase-related protein n=1 Tax=unclassified Janthinobacterium TaxID=2610881 RepID=UPI000C16F58D|nr:MULTISPECIES: glutamate synthase-related protein [unclassified Janthinobacterium]MDN2674749.1 glutamate synthase-related protein [Janthinobacterium sp. SUN026]MDN2706023.1 glutamate synthase-related protein [Janthinobacterium sp. SUN100]MDO8042915.1 glutamate synthase-related protein [Janthinobacterium sp. SUN137]MDO8051524.1 glutamate synthase-related protein [Janthinobacterium sp. SUN211]MDO8069724.1 glutamate synthase-related protein [Janthinobacterium sp. SUN206]